MAANVGKMNPECRRKPKDKSKREDISRGMKWLVVSKVLDRPSKIDSANLLSLLTFIWN